MCTLSVIKITTNNELIITMNRDEQRTREEENYLEITDNFCHPIDKLSGGTWIGANNSGLVFAILNRYQDKNIKGATSSRGEIIPFLLESKNIQQAQEKFLNLNHSKYSPFDLIAISQNKLIKFSFNGDELATFEQSLSESFFVTSSSVRTNEVLAYRKDIFEKFIAINTDFDSDIILKELHKKVTDSDDSSSIFMNREITHTKSITQVKLNSDNAMLLYENLNGKNYSHLL